MQQGWVYVLINPTIPGLVKVGRTTRLPSTRVAELSHATGVASPFLSVFEHAFVDCVAAERDIHAVLDHHGMRFTPNREFFKGAVSEIVRLILEYAGEALDHDLGDALQSGMELLRQGDQSLFGGSARLQDLSEAVRFYQRAAARGSLLAFERLGVIVAQTRGDTRAGRARAIAFLKEGARRGNYYCYCDLAGAAAEEGNTPNFRRAWDLFFLFRQTAWLAEVEEGDARYATALRRYVVTCFALGMRPAHLSLLTAEAEPLIGALTQALSGVHRQPAARRILMVALQWAGEALMQAPPSGATVALLRGWAPRLTERLRGLAA